jgi:3-hydroxymyristoyl/3-hydroxydecanoyl-(acyl carrier protein) dehydratase
VPHAFPCRLVEKLEVVGEARVAIVLGTAGGTLTGIGPWPVTLVAEALAQAILLVEPPDRLDGLRLVGLREVEALQPVEAGDRIEVDVTAEGSFGALRRYSCRARKAGALVAMAQITVSS